MELGRIIKFLVLALVFCVSAAYGQILNGVLDVQSSNSIIKITDNFMRADANPLSGNWHTDTSLCNLQISSDLVTVTTPNAQCLEYNTGATYPANQKAVATISALGAGFSYAGASVRDDGAGDGYFAEGASTSDPSIYVEKCTAGTCVTMGATFSYTFAMGDKIELDASGTSTTTLTLSVNGVSQGTRTDSSSPFTSGNPGLAAYGGVVIASEAISNFCGGSLTATC